MYEANWRTKSTSDYKSNELKGASLNHDIKQLINSITQNIKAYTACTPLEIKRKHHLKSLHKSHIFKASTQITRLQSNYINHSSSKQVHKSHVFKASTQITYLCSSTKWNSFKFSCWLALLQLLPSNSHTSALHQCSFTLDDFSELFSIVLQRLVMRVYLQRSLVIHQSYVWGNKVF